MGRLGFIRDMMDVKVLILYVVARLKTPANAQEIYELCYQDDKLSYFDVCTAIPELVSSGHLQEVQGNCYVITEKGKTNGEVTEDSIAYPVKERAHKAVDRFNKERRRSEFVHTELIPGENGEVIARMCYNDAHGRLMTLDLTAPSQPQAVKLTRSFQSNAEIIYNLLLSDLLDEENFGE